ncbi:protein kinase domain-containing protein [Citrus sinensis]|uniref:Protein kinase domain-containing protein n=1 Tax=Citrus sinensis TaxID=2711 RepID=A0ACB8MU47_CITSI|nr:protein kinase domain-containing protein [Citrus sinensis]KAH9789344.1 protein kinase domain-containing protein [Citrus sinensis]
MNNHPNIVKLRNLVKEHEDVFIVFDYMESDLLKLMKESAGQNFSEDEARNLCFQVFQGLHYMHRQGYFHRDLKPSNLLVSKGVIKIGDLGMVKEIDSSLPCTDYVTTRWYRAPEVLLLSEICGPEVDSLISWLCSWNPRMRPTAAEALEHPFFRSCHFVPRSVPLLCNNFEAVAFPTATVTMQGRSLTYSQVPNDGQLCSCVKCEMQRTNHDHMIINSAKPATSVICKTGYATRTEMLASRMQPLQQLMMSRPPGF